MKKLLLFGLAIFLFVACKQQDTRYTQSSPEIETIKSIIKSYDAKDYGAIAQHYADTSKTFFNKTKLTPKEIAAYHKQNDLNYSSRGFESDNQEYEMITTDDGETWVNFWATWKGTLAANGKEVTIPIHITSRFIDGKIVRESGYWDASEIVLDLLGINAANNTPKKNASVVNEMYAAFAKGDIPSVLENLDQNVIWNEAEGNSYADGNPYVGPDAVLNGVFKRVGDDYEYFNLEDIQLHEMANNQILANMRYKGKLKKNGAVIDAQAAHLWTFKDGKAIGFQQYVDTKQLNEAINN